MFEARSHPDGIFAALCHQSNRHKSLKNKELIQIKKHKKDKLRTSTKKELRNPMFGRRFFFSPVIQRD
ncbi:hypothetical protein [Dickeya dadantii]|uniref:hypothetical protein n=1 Tax=Dickeya dadantii TaxID=204038 RepID=UPI001C0CDB6A|nr:hypothetical protein [Dickeya dadantii]QWT40776.1 hypothetical protein KNV89_21110 [Dickeya dadantii]